MTRVIASLLTAIVQTALPLVTKALSKALRRKQGVKNSKV